MDDRWFRLGDHGRYSAIMLNMFFGDFKMATLDQETQNIDCVDLQKRKYVITKYTFTKIDKTVKTVWNKYQPDTFLNKFDTLKLSLIHI